MKRLQKGPELKMPELKVPPFLADLYHDLVDRKLLPLVALVAVAIVAVPFLLGGGSAEELEPVAPQEPIGGISSAPADGARLTVVEANPGLRDYRKRLSARKPTDPFEQRFSGPVRAGGQLSEEIPTSGTPSSSEGSTVTSTSPTVPEALPEPEGSTGGGGGAPPSGGSGSADPQLRLFTFAIDVKIKRTTTAPDGGKEEDEPVTRERVVPPTALPSEKTQVITYMGISPKTRNPLLLVSDDVTAIFGEAKCLSGSESCQLLEVEPGLPMTFVYGPGAARFKINVLKVEPVLGGRS